MNRINRALSLIILLLLLPESGGAEAPFTKGIFGVPSVAGMPAEWRAELLEGIEGVDAVFTPADGETIRFFKARGYRVFLSVNAFGGAAAWRQFPDARPVLADGRRLGEPHGPAGDDTAGLPSRTGQTGSSSAYKRPSSGDPPRAQEAELPNPPTNARNGASPRVRQAAIVEEARHGGVCPTHEGWRAARLREIRDLLERFGGRKEGIDGIWLDFIRYPGAWEKPEAELRVSQTPGSPAIPDACYCPRCLAKFSRDTGVALPVAPGRTADAAAWLRENHPYEWMAWKNGRINSFARDVRALIEKDAAVPPSKESNGRAGPVILGAFVVPWTKGEKDGAATFLLGQDAFALAEIVDVISPMVYHRMVGKDAAWVGEMTEYYTEQARCAVWPIIQSADTTAGEFAQTARCAGLGGAGGLLVFSHRGMDEAKRQALAAFRPPENLIPNPEFNPEFRKTGDGAAVSPWPASWSVNEKGLGEIYGPRYGLVPFDDLFPQQLGTAPIYSVGEKKGAVPIYLAVKGGTEVPGEWRAPLPACEPGQAYRLSCIFHRDTWNELSYSYASVWGWRYLLEKHSSPRTAQPLRVTVVCPRTPTDPFFRFTNEVPDDYFYLADPRLVRGLPLPVPAPAPHGGFFYPGFFPIGIYGAKTDDLVELRKIALNTVIIGGEGGELKKAVMEARRNGLRYVLATPRDPGRLKVYLDRLAEIPVPKDDNQLAFYVEDEPEMRAVAAGRAEDVRRLIRARFPSASTGMATVRPSYTREYQQASDFFMIDNYPFPDMPMSWLGDSMDRAAEEVGRDRLLSVVQAFSDGNYWPSMPGWRQMDCLAFLSVIHGSRGIFFYNWTAIGMTKEGRANLGRVVGRLNRIYLWLLEKNVPAPVGVEMLSEHRFDPRGRPPVHACLKRRGDEMMLIAVNTIGAPVEARLDVSRELSRLRGNQASVPASGATAREVFSGAAYPIRDGAIRTILKPYETRAFLLNK